MWCLTQEVMFITKVNIWEERYDEWDHNETANKWDAGKKNVKENI
jgi:hypothetical protein